MGNRFRAITVIAILTILGIIGYFGSESIEPDVDANGPAIPPSVAAPDFEVTPDIYAVQAFDLDGEVYPAHRAQDYVSTRD